jgi:large subunit ribosomal protein L29
MTAQTPYTTMKKNIPELRAASDAELKKRIEEEKQNLSNLKFQKVFSQLENPMKVRHIRRDIARMKTILRERQLAAAKTPTPPSKSEEKSA